MSRGLQSSYFAPISLSDSRVAETETDSGNMAASSVRQQLAALSNAGGGGSHKERTEK